MINNLFRGLLAINSVMIFGTVYLVKSGIWLLDPTYLDKFGTRIPDSRIISIVVYIVVPVLIAGICLLLARLLPTDSIEGGIEDIELANDSFLPSYLGYFFVALSVPKDDITIYVVIGLLIVFLFCSQNLYYNPIFLIFGYHFYYVTTQERMKKFIITREKISGIQDLKFEHLKRINYFTYIDQGD